MIGADARRQPNMRAAIRIRLSPPDLSVYRRWFLTALMFFPYEHFDSSFGSTQVVSRMIFYILVRVMTRSSKFQTHRM
jgi:hypothetical protein